MAACSRPARPTAGEGEASPEANSSPGGADSAAASSPPATPRFPRLGEGPFPLLPWAARVIAREYFDTSRIDPRVQFDYALERLGVAAPEFFATVAQDGRSVDVKVGSASRRFELLPAADALALSRVLQHVLEFVRDQRKLDEDALHELEYAAVNGFLAPLDPHTVLLTPKEHSALGVRTRGRFGGIGAEILAEDSRIRILRVLPNTPAERAGLLDDDIVLRIDQRSTVDMTARDAQEVLRGPVGEPVELRVRRGDAIVTIVIERGMIDVPAVMALALPERVGYVQLTRFQEDATEKVAQAVRDLVGAGSRSIVFDLRSNSGGLLTQATGIVDLFVDEGELVSVLSASGREAEPATDAMVVGEEIGLVVLIDQNSASAAEIVSGSLGRLGRALVVGRTSFGKGTVQRLREVRPYGDELSLKLTIAEYRVAKDGKIRSRGVAPHLSLFPVRFGQLPGIGRLYDGEIFEDVRERSRTAHLPSARHDAAIVAQARSRTPRPLRYYDAPLDDDGAKADADTSALERRRQRILRDPEVRISAALARELAGVEQPTARESRLAAFRARTEAQEDARIVAALAEHEIDWSGEVGRGEATALELSARRVAIPDEGKKKRKRKRRKTGAKPTALPLPKAGEAFRVEVSVHNPGTRAVERVSLRTDCEHTELDGIELAVGRIDAGQTVTRSFDLQLMQWRPDLSTQLEFTAHAGEPDSHPDGHTRLQIAVRGRDKPELAFDYWIVDDPALATDAPKRPEMELLPGQHEFQVNGNGDGMLQAGEAVLLAFAARNEGAAADDLRIVVRNRSSRVALLEEAQLRLGKLAGGGRAYGAIGLSLAPRADGTIPVELEVFVGDTRSRVSVSKSLVFALGPAGSGSPPQVIEGYRTPAKAGVAARLEAGASSPVVARLPAQRPLPVVARQGEWLAIDLGRARRIWVRDGELSAVDKPRGRVEVTKLPAAVAPPRLRLAEVGERTTRERVEIRGDALDESGVRDVVVSVRPSAEGHRERKIFHRANASGGRRLAFSLSVPLEPGSNLVRITSRDAQEVEREHRIWVFRERPSNGLAPAED